MRLLMRSSASGFPGPIVAISRRGLLPQRQVPASPWPTPAFTEAERRSLAHLARRIQREVAEAQARGVPWQNVVDSLRPLVTALWQGLPDAEQRRFLRHARPWWDVHRHRMSL